MHAFRFVRLVRIDGLDGARRIASNAAGRRKLAILVRAIPVAHPLPFVSTNVVQAVIVGRMLCDRSDSRTTPCAFRHRLTKLLNQAVFEGESNQLGAVVEA